MTVGSGGRALLWGTGTLTRIQTDQWAKANLDLCRTPCDALRTPERRKRQRVARRPPAIPHVPGGRQETDSPWFPGLTGGAFCPSPRRLEL